MFDYFHAQEAEEMGIARLVDEMIPPDPATAAQHPMAAPAPLPA